MATKAVEQPPDELQGFVSPKQRLLVFIVAYNAERTIEAVLHRIPPELAAAYDVEVLVIDDASPDATFERGYEVRRDETLPFTLHVLFNPVNQGYGGNQKIGFHFAIKEDFDFVALLHGDGQYAPECLPDLVKPLALGDADAVLGSRMLESGAARRGGMPGYKFVGNKILTWWENRMLRTSLSEFHSGYRIYSTEALLRIPFDLNTNDFHFDTEIIIQLLLAEQRITEIPIPTYYGDEICHVNGVKYGWDVIKTATKARIQEQSLLYDRKFDVKPVEQEGSTRYTPKLEHESPQALALEIVEPGSRVLDLGCAGGMLAAELRRRKSCHVVGVDLFPLAPGLELDEFHLHDLNERTLPVRLDRFDYVLMLDVIEHLADPEAFMDRLRDAAQMNPDLILLMSTGNVAFALTRLLLLAGQFNYGKRGILDLTHTRLFTFATLRRLLDGAGFAIVDERGIPAPFPLALGPGPAGRMSLQLNRAAIRLRKQLFAYQAFVVARPVPSLGFLLARASEKSSARAASIDARLDGWSAPDVHGASRGS
jgi:2-polyprenyl-3-methyl-5-hydroxy-6-metoxy-1,4-benzoquinol methylase